MKFLITIKKQEKNNEIICFLSFNIKLLLVTSKNNINLIRLVHLQEIFLI